MRRPGLALKLSVLLMLGVVGAMLVASWLSSPADAELGRARVLLFVVVALGMAMVAASGLDWLVIRPLTRLSAAARRMEEANYADPFPVVGVDEPRELAEALERLRRQVVAERAELQRLNQELEARVTERSEELAAAQRALLEEQRLSAVGRLAAGVAHEVNNPAGVILMRAELLLEEADRLPPDASDDLRVIARQAERIRSITGALLRLGQPPRSERLPIDLAAIARSAAELVSREAASRGVELHVEGHAEPALGDSAALEQVLYNLLRNAVQATGPGGRVQLAVSGRTARVEDSGPGIGAESLPHLFEPFFTTKPVGEGTGLGLAIAHGIVREHGSELRAENRAEGGARFSFTLPAAAAELPAGG